MDEYISRGDVLDIVSQYCPDDDGSCSKADVDPREMLDEIEALPASDVKPEKHGKWEYNEKPIFGNPYGRYCCSLCGCAMDSGTDNYCPCCGARMDGDTD